MKEKEDLSKGEISQILSEFGAKFDIMKCSYRDGDPVCPRCHYS
jgi:hypothetical protein